MSQSGSILTSPRDVEYLLKAFVARLTSVVHASVRVMLVLLSFRVAPTLARLFHVKVRPFFYTQTHKPAPDSILRFGRFRPYPFWRVYVNRCLSRLKFQPQKKDLKKKHTHTLSKIIFQTLTKNVLQSSSLDCTGFFRCLTFTSLMPCHGPPY